MAEYNDASARRILRWSIPVDDRPHNIAISGPVVHVDARSSDSVEFWTSEVGPPYRRPATFQVVATGQTFPSDWEHVGSVVTAGGALVWHLMRLPYDGRGAVLHG